MELSSLNKALIFVLITCSFASGQVHATTWPSARAGTWERNEATKF